MSENRNSSGKPAEKMTWKLRVYNDMWVQNLGFAYREIVGNAKKILLLSD